MGDIATMLHISDLHFVKKLTEEGRAWYAKALDLVKVKPHSFTKIDALAAQIKDIERRSGKFDIVLGTGDLTTNGSEGAFKTVLNYLESEEISRGNPSRPITEGLAAGKPNRLLLPGNHDRYTRDWVPMQSRSNTFETVLKVKPLEGYPYVRGYRRPDVSQMQDEPALLFFIFDSTPPATVGYWPGDEGARTTFWPTERIARGRLEAVECRKLLKLANKIIETREVEGFDGQTIPVDFHKCIRIAVLHHHPLDVRGTTLMENNEMFIGYCFKAGIDLVLFGHDHKKFYLPRYTEEPAEVISVGNPHWIHFFCCPSTSEYSAKNGFYIFDFNHDHFTFQLFEWEKGSFVPYAGNKESSFPQTKIPVKVFYSRK
jgi:hypothetical protein